MKIRYSVPHIHLASLCLLILALFLLGSCTSKNRFYVNVNAIPLHLTIHPFEQDFFAIDTSHVAEGLAQLHSKYGPYLNLYLHNVMQFDTVGSKEVDDQVRAFLEDTAVRSIFRETIRQYANDSDILAKVTDAFKRFHYFFPNHSIPQLYFHVSMFNQSVVTDNNVVSLSVDNYLGPNYYWYKKIVYDYLRYNMRRDKVPSDFMVAYLLSEFPMAPSDRFLDNMLYRGKLMYMLAALMPDEKPNVLMGYTPQQMEWCKKNEKGIWLNLLDNKQLYSTDPMVSTTYLNDAPFTSGVSQNSPGRIGIWLGWQIVAQYMDHHTSVTLPQLIADNNYQKMLEDSGYKP
ncbi:hypothetical protein [Microbacter margulisiae]|uniref:Gliding motility-associated lipoprotein GldB n=1 Tax=Microbacter margulisiae TaxID=1350067 RepID=A0A7W5H2D2_9PORP|nr:hypothetical protein [Microbacter margulisiae]MBB3188553.1 hypothetical protein [Microbacter margulisiae]